MASIKQTITNTGPVLHLHEIRALPVFNIVEQVAMPPEVESELKKNNVPREKIKANTIKLKARSKDLTKALQQTHRIDLGEAEAITLSKQEQINLFFTDDLDARRVAKHLDIEVRGTLGIITKAYAEKKLTKKRTIELIQHLYQDSSLFLTKDIVDWVLEQIQ